MYITGTCTCPRLRIYASHLLSYCLRHACCFCHGAPTSVKQNILLTVCGIRLAYTRHILSRLHCLTHRSPPVNPSDFERCNKSVVRSPMSSAMAAATVVTTTAVPSSVPAAAATVPTAATVASTAVAAAISTVAAPAPPPVMLGGELGLALLLHLLPLHCSGHGRRSAVVPAVVPAGALSCASAVPLLGLPSRLARTLVIIVRLRVGGPVVLPLRALAADLGLDAVAAHGVAAHGGAPGLTGICMRQEACKQRSTISLSSVHTRARGRAHVEFKHFEHRLDNPSLS